MNFIETKFIYLINQIYNFSSLLKPFTTVFLLSSNLLTFANPCRQLVGNNFYIDKHNITFPQHEINPFSALLNFTENLSCSLTLNPTKLDVLYICENEGHTISPIINTECTNDGHSPIYDFSSDFCYEQESYQVKLTINIKENHKNTFSITTDRSLCKTQDMSSVYNTSAHESIRLKQISTQSKITSRDSDLTMSCPMGLPYENIPNSTNFYGEVSSWSSKSRHSHFIKGLDQETLNLQLEKLNDLLYGVPSEQVIGSSELTQYINKLSHCVLITTIDSHKRIHFLPFYVQEHINIDNIKKIEDNSVTQTTKNGNNTGSVVLNGVIYKITDVYANDDGKIILTFSSILENLPLRIQMKDNHEIYNNENNLHYNLLSAENYELDNPQSKFSGTDPQNAEPISDKTGLSSNSDQLSQDGVRVFQRTRSAAFSHSSEPEIKPKDSHPVKRFSINRSSGDVEKAGVARVVPNERDPTRSLSYSKESSRPKGRDHLSKSESHTGDNPEYLPHRGIDYGRSIIVEKSHPLNPQAQNVVSSQKYVTSAVKVPRRVSLGTTDLLSDSISDNLVPGSCQSFMANNVYVISSTDRDHLIMKTKNDFKYIKEIPIDNFNFLMVNPLSSILSLKGYSYNVLMCSNIMDGNGELGGKSNVVSFFIAERENHLYYFIIYKDYEDHLTFNFLSDFPLKPNYSHWLTQNFPSIFTSSCSQLASKIVKFTRFQITLPRRTVDTFRSLYHLQNFLYCSITVVPTSNESIFICETDNIHDVTPIIRAQCSKSLFSDTYSLTASRDYDKGQHYMVNLNISLVNSSKNSFTLSMGAIEPTPSMQQSSTMHPDVFTSASLSTNEAPSSAASISGDANAIPYSQASLDAHLQEVDDILYGVPIKETISGDKILEYLNSLNHSVLIHIVNMKNSYLPFYIVEKILVSSFKNLTGSVVVEGYKAARSISGVINVGGELYSIDRALLHNGSLELNFTSEKKTKLIKIAFYDNDIESSDKSKLHYKSLQFFQTFSHN